MLGYTLLERRANTANQIINPIKHMQLKYFNIKTQTQMGSICLVTKIRCRII